MKVEEDNFIGEEGDKTELEEGKEVVKTGVGPLETETVAEDTEMGDEPREGEGCELARDVEFRDADKVG